MKTLRRTSSILTLALAALASYPTSVRADGPSAHDIMDKAATSRKLDGSESLVKMTIVDEKGQTRERKITMASKAYDGGKTEKRILRFLSPADVKGTGVLVFDYEASADDVWIYVPALRKTRRIVSSQRSQAFVGSEFSYGDLNVPALEDYNYALVKEDSAGGEACWVIDVVPKEKATADSEGYSKKTYWISKATYTLRKGLFYDQAGKLLKELECSDIKQLDAKKNRYRAMKMEMKNVQNGRRSLFESEKIAVTTDTNDDFFTARYLERE